MAGIHMRERAGEGGGVPCEAHTYCKLWTVDLVYLQKDSSFIPSKLDLCPKSDKAI